jgi:hypothetical protein
MLAGLISQIISISGEKFSTAVEHFSKLPIAENKGLQDQL